MLASTAAGNEVMYQDLLGSALNILDKPNIFDIISVMKCIKTKRIITLSPETTEVSVPGIEAKLTVSKDIRIVSSGIGTNSTGIQVESGSELTHKLTVSSKLHDAFLGMKLEAEGGYSYENSVNKSSMYALMAIDQTQFYTALTTGHREGDLDQDFRAAVENLPPWREAEKEKSAYKAFFNTWGTHVIKRCHYGCRFILKIETENAAFTSKTDYTANVKAEYGDVFSTSANIEKGVSFNEYKKKRDTKSRVIGGDPQSSLILQGDPGNKDKYDNWAKTNNKANNSAVTGVTVNTIPKLLRDCNVEKWEHMDNALKYFTKSVGPQPITVYGHFLTYEPKKSSYDLDVCIWGLSTFYLNSLDGGSTKDTQDPTIKKITTNPKFSQRQFWNWEIRRYTAQVEIRGETGKEYTITVWNPEGSKGVKLWLFPPTGPIEIFFDKEAQLNKVTIPHLLASGVYRSSAL
ncbi:MAC/Perforin domain-containing protein [Aspergillus sergii]|uniref:MAC/Perforin domain-containing protein n=1 Tax=Aspergillus sergii TaxID=1034303 RepID=A0A5N6X615_9EURO|nr:MAC/Perforin domain-containing protein [Aspergillus sergii]